MAKFFPEKFTPALQRKKVKMAKKKSSKSKLSLGIALFALGVLLVAGRGDRLTDLSNYTFASEPVQVQGFTITEQEITDLPNRILVPELSIDLPVEEAKIIQGYWEVFEDKAGWGAGSGLPGNAGNQVIFAHARDGLFLPLKEVSAGMRIYVLTDGEKDIPTLEQDTPEESQSNPDWFAYEIVEIKEVFPNQIEVIEPTEDETLTLYTCSGFNDSKRLIVVAKRI